MERQTGSERTINNTFYDQLGDEWLGRSDHPIALLRAENKVRIPWICDEIKKEFSLADVLDIGCGGGLLTNALALEGHRVTGVDLSQSSLDVAKKSDTTASVRYLNANGYSLPFTPSSFDAVCAMDVLEHVEEPHLLIAEASRVLRPGGLFFFHTFNRNLLSYILVIKGVEWAVSNTPPNMHVYPLFIKPSELKQICWEEGLRIFQWRGFEPKIFSLATLKMLVTRKVPPSFGFRFSKSLATGYCGIAKKED